MGYRPRSGGHNGPRRSELDDLKREKASYEFLLTEWEPHPGSALEQSLEESIEDVNRRIRASSPPLPPPNRSITTRGFMA